MRALRSKDFWIGAVVVYVLLAFAPQLLVNVRGLGAKASVGRA